MIPIFLLVYHIKFGFVIPCYIASNLQYRCMVLKLWALPMSQTISTIGLHLEMFHMLINCKHEDCHFNYQNYSLLYYDLKSSILV